MPKETEGQSALRKQARKGAAVRQAIEPGPAAGSKTNMFHKLQQGKAKVSFGNVEAQKKLKVKEERRALAKKMFTQKTKKGQPVMKNYIQYLVHQLENEKKRD